MSKRAPKKDPPPGNRTPAKAPEERAAEVGREFGAGAGRWRSWLKAGLRVGEPLSVAILLAFLLWKSWLRWPDPLVDFPRDLYLAWRVSEGDKLYVGIANWYGPLAQLVQGAGFKIFGVGLDTMVGMNMVLLTGVLLLSRGILGAEGNRLSVWLGSVVFVVVFAVGQFTPAGNYNFITPYVAQATYTFAGLLVTLWGLLRHLKTERWRWLVVAGLGLAVAYLDKPEGLLAALGALGFYFMARIVQRARQDPARTNWRAAGGWAARALGWVAAGFFALWLPVFAYFLFRGGLSYAFLATDYVAHTMVSSAFQHAIMNASIMGEISGFDHPGANFAAELKEGCWLLAVCAVMVGAARGWMQARFAGGWWWFWSVVAVAAGVAGVKLGEQMNYWVDAGGALVFPVLLTTLVTVAGTGRMAWERRKNFTSWLGLGLVAVAASVMLGRMLLNGRFNHYGFFMMPLAVLLWIQVMFRAAAHTRTGDVAGRRNVLLAVVFTGVVLTATADLLHVDLAVYQYKDYPVGQGRDHFYAFPPDKDLSGIKLNLMLEMFKEKSPGARTLVAFPEGIAVNYDLRVRTPLADLEFLPVALSFVGTQHVVDELAAHPPDAVFLYRRDMAEFGAKYFGDGPATGAAIVHWLNQHEMIIGAEGGPVPTATGHVVDLLVPRTADAKLVPGGGMVP